MKRALMVSFLLMVMSGAGLPEEPLSGQSDEGQTQTPQVRRLILKDGSFEPVDRFSIENDRVRYFSTDRYVWEELPLALIDWPATEDYARRAAAKASSRMNETLAKAAAEKREEEARMPLIAPGLRLPFYDGVFLLDVYRGRTELNRLAQNEADLNKNTGSNILRGVFNPIAGSKQTVELAGLHARIQSHVQTPEIFFPVNHPGVPADTEAASAEDRFRIVRCENKKGNRIAAVYNISILGKVKRQAQYIELKVEPVSAYWVKISPAAPLKRGEYALVEFDRKGAMNLFVWDFGINPAAPANSPMEIEIPEREEPVLIQKSREKAATPAKKNATGD